MHEGTVRKRLSANQGVVLTRNQALAGPDLRLPASITVGK